MHILSPVTDNWPSLRKEKQRYVAGPGKETGTSGSDWWWWISTGPGCSKLTTLLVNVLLKISNVNIWNMPIFYIEKISEAFALQSDSFFLGGWGGVVCSKLTTLLVNVMLKISIASIWNMPLFFIEKIWEAFALQSDSFFLSVCVCVCGGGGGRWMDRQQAQTNLPLQLLWSWEHNNE